ncbi:MAG: amino acid ABC transporter permease [Anaerolineaceae bacterium]|nr:amino acid ABC transporter permease [Anaerolineaceae bacterium]
MEMNQNKKSNLFDIIGNETAPQKLDPWWWLVFVVVATIAVLALAAPDPYLNMLKFFMDGIGVSIFVTVVAFVFVLVVGLLGGLGRMSKNPLIYGITTIYVEIVRGVPLLVQLLFWYFAFPSVIQHIGIAFEIEAFKRYLANPVGMAILGLVFCYAAYMSEIYRAGIQSIAKGQMEAARSLGMTHFQAMRYIVLPQAIRVILPPVGNEFIALLKDSSLVSVVAVADLTRRGREYMAAHFTPIETWMLVGLVYLVMTLVASRIVTWVEKKSKME